MKPKQTKYNFTPKMVWMDKSQIYGIVYKKHAKQILKNHQYKKYEAGTYELYEKIFVWNNGLNFYFQRFKKEKHSYDIEFFKQLEAIMKLLDQEIMEIYYPKKPMPLVLRSADSAYENEMYWVIAPRVD